MDPLDFAIQRDDAYKRTLAKDLRRQSVRRTVHRLARHYERTVLYPRWQGNQASFSKKTLSTCIMVMNAADRIAPLLKYIRPFSDEIVVGVDSKTIDNTWDVCQGLADELFLIENNSLTCNAGMEALVAHCHGDWILRLDDDEYPEPHFTQIKAALLNTEKYTHYKLPRLHLCSTEPLMWINDSYLYPDFQMRLFKNKPELLKFPGAIGHLGIECAGPKGRVNTVNLVHLNMAINPRQQREEKLSKYIARLNGGWVHPVNEHALLFEDFNYRIQPYNYNDSAFKQLLTEVIQTQRSIYETKNAR